MQDKSFLKEMRWWEGGLKWGHAMFIKKCAIKCWSACHVMYVKKTYIICIHQSIPPFHRICSGQSRVFSSPTTLWISETRGQEQSRAREIRGAFPEEQNWRRQICRREGQIPEIFDATPHHSQQLHPRARRRQMVAPAQKAEISAGAPSGVIQDRMKSATKFVVKPILIKRLLHN